MNDHSHKKTDPSNLLFGSEIFFPFHSLTGKLKKASINSFLTCLTMHIYFLYPANKLHKTLIFYISDVQRSKSMKIILPSLNHGHNPSDAH